MTLVTDKTGIARSEQVVVGHYRLVPQSVDGLMGTPAPLHIVIGRGTSTRVAVTYDTGIR